MIHTDLDAMLEVVSDPVRHRVERGLGATELPFLFFQFLDYQSGISDNIVPEYSTYSPIGRIAPFLHYTGSGNRVLKFGAVFMDEEIPGEAFRKSVLLQSWMLPTINPRTEPYLLELLPPPRLALFLLFAKIRVEGFLTAAQSLFQTPLIFEGPREAVEYETMRGLYRTPLPAEPDRAYPGQVTMDLEFTVDEDPSIYSADVFLTATE